MSKVILFDLDGTLINSEDGIYESFDFARKELKMEFITKNDFKAFIGPPIDKIFSSIYKNSNNKNKFITIYRNHYDNKGFKKFSLKFSYEKIEKISSNYPIGVVTNKPSVSTNKILNHANIFQFFQEIVCRDSFNKKGNKVENLSKVVIKFVKINKFQKKNIFYVGDTLEDFKAAKKNNINFIGISDGYFSWEPFKSLKNDMILYDCLDSFLEEIE